MLIWKVRKGTCGEFKSLDPSHITSQWEIQAPREFCVLDLAHNVHECAYGVHFRTFQNVSLLRVTYCQALCQFHEQR